MFKASKQGLNLPEPVSEIEVAVCKGEWESTQIIIVPFCDSIYNLEITAKGNEIAKGKVECFSGEYAYCTYSAYPNTNDGWYADPLVLANVSEYNNDLLKFAIYDDLSIIKFGEVKSVWLNYNIPYDIKSGIYNFQINIKAQTSKNKTTCENVNIKLVIYDFAMPETMHLKTAFSFDKNSFLKYYNVDSIPKDIDKEHYTFYLKYRLNPVSLYTDIWHTYPPIDDWQWCIDRGANFFNLGYLGYFNQSNSVNKFKSELIKKIKYIKSNNLMQYTYIYGFDEVKQNNFQKLTQMRNIVRQVDNDLKFACTVKPVETLKNSVDIWVPLTSAFSEKTQKFNTNEELWWYVCCIPYHPYPNFFIEYPAIAPRIIFWQASKYNIDGFLYYLTNSWSYNNNVKSLTKETNPFIDDIRKGKKWPDVPWSGLSFRWNETYRFYNGDGQLVYPGKNMKLYPSVRLINIRDGIEDYECFYQMKLIIDKYKKNNDRSKVNILEEFMNNAYQLVPSEKEYINSPEKLLEIKKQTLKLLSEYY